MYYWVVLIRIKPFCILMCLTVSLLNYYIPEMYGSVLFGSLNRTPCNHTNALYIRSSLTARSDRQLSSLINTCDLMKLMKEKGYVVLLLYHKLGGCG